MTIKYNSAQSWGYFPYPPNHAEGYSNNGGFDLTKDPSLVHKITELENLPRIKESVFALNKEETPFMTTGFLCAQKDPDSLFHGYLEFCFRPHVDYSKIKIDSLDDAFVAHALDKYGQQVADFYQKEFRWEMHKGSVHGSDPVHVYTVFYRARTYDEAERQLLLLFRWLQNDFLEVLP